MVRFGRRLVVVCAALQLAACVGTEPRLTLGAQCDLSSECEAPLVCRLDRCRRECVSTRDCGLGLRCVRAQDGLGVCQLPEERTCVRNSECPAGLVCRAETCTNECAADRDCAAGQRCETDAEGASCVEVSPHLCVYNTDCPEPLVCDSRQQCRPECADDSDCGDRRCLPHEACDGEPCMCRRDCSAGEACPAGFACEPCPEGLDCGDVTSFCARVPE